MKSKVRCRARQSSTTPRLLAKWAERRPTTPISSVRISAASWSSSASDSSFRSAGDWIRPSTESGWFINDPFPKEPAPGSRRRSPRGPSGSSAATASSANCRARRRLPSTPRNLGYVHLPSSESLPTRLPSLVSSPWTSSRSSTIWNARSHGPAVTVEGLDAQARGPRRSRPPCAAGRGAGPRSCGGGSPRAPPSVPVVRPRRAVPSWLQLGSPFGLEVGHLAGHHARRAGRLGQDLHAPQRRRPRPDLARPPPRTPGSRDRPPPGSPWPRRTPCGRSVGRAAGRRRPSPADRRGSANRCAPSPAHRPPAIAASPVAAARLGRHQAQHRPQPLAAPQHAVTHRHRQPRRTRRCRVRVNLRQIARPTPPRPVAAPGPDTRQAPTPRSMSWQNSSCFNPLPPQRQGEPARFETTNRWPSAPCSGTHADRVFHPRATKNAPLLLTFVPRKST